MCNAGSEGMHIFRFSLNSFELNGSFLKSKFYKKSRQFCQNILELYQLSQEFLTPLTAQIIPPILHFLRKHLACHKYCRCPLTG